MIKILVIDNDSEILQGLKEFFESDVDKNYSLEYCNFTEFDKMKDGVDIIVTDYSYEGTDPDAGLVIFNKIKETKFAPVIIYSGRIGSIDPSIVQGEHPFLSIIEKGHNSEHKLKGKIEEIIDNNIFKTRSNLIKNIEHSISEYYWLSVEKSWDSIKDMDESVLSRSLSRKVLKDLHSKLLGDDKVNEMEFYEYPLSNTSTVETGSILKKDDKFFVCINNNCDLIVRKDRTKVKKMCLLEVKEIPSDWLQNNNEKESIMNNNSAKYKNRIFFLPKTDFFPGGYVSFDDITTKDIRVEEGLINLDDIGVNFAKIHSPFIQRLISNFTRHYSRVATPDIDIQ